MFPNCNLSSTTHNPSPSPTFSKPLTAALTMTSLAHPLKSNWSLPSAPGREHVTRMTASTASRVTPAFRPNLPSSMHAIKKSCQGSESISTQLNPAMSERAPQLNSHHITSRHVMSHHTKLSLSLRLSLSLSLSLSLALSLNPYLALTHTWTMK